MTTQINTEAAIKMVILDAIEKGHTDKNDLILYMSSKTFENAVRRYLSLMNN